MSTSTLTPKYHWTFSEIQGSITTDTVSQATAQMSNVIMSGQGRIGNAVALSGADDSFISLGRQIGQFGRADFTVAFGVRIVEISQRADLVGNRTSASHGNFFQIRLHPNGVVTAEVDEDANGRNYNALESPAGMLNDRGWHHIAVVRQQTELRLYIDGSLAVKNSVSGVANIANGNEFRVGNANPGVDDRAVAPNAEFEDLRIYDRPLNDQQIAALVPPLRKGEIELKSPSGAAITLASDMSDLTRLALPIEKLQLGPGTAVTLYKDPNFAGVSQEVAANLPKFADTRLGASPKSIKIWPTAGALYTGNWAFLAPDGQYLSLADRFLSTSPCVTNFEQFTVIRQTPRQWLQIIPGSSLPNSGSTDIRINSAGSASRLLCVEEEADFRRFSLMHQQRDRWLKLVPNNRIALKSFNGKYVRAADGGGGSVFADRDYPLADELFNLVPVANNRVALATVRKGLYVSAVNGGGGAVNAQIPKLDAWETFILEKLEGNKIALKTASKGLYVCAEGGGGRELVANRQQRNIWETFEQVNLGGFDWTTNKDERAIFTSAIKVADHESKVGELFPGEVAFYENAAYWGKAWVLYDSHPDFKAIQGFDNVVSSIRLGPETGATLYVNPAYGATTPGQDAEKDIEDIVEDVPDLRTAQVGSDKLSSVKVWRTLSPKQANIDFSITLSQDYKLVPGQEKLQDFSSYRSILKFLPEVKEVEVWATDATQIEVDGKYYDVSEDNSLKLIPNSMNRLMITSEAEGINTPGLKIRTNTMKAFERVVIFPDREVHRQIADLEEGALWNATILVPDPNNPEILKEEKLVKPGVSTAEQVQVVQNTMTNMMRTVSYVSASQDDKTQLVDREINADAIEKPCVLEFTTTGIRSADPTRPTPMRVEETDVTQEQFLAMMAGASAPLAQSWKNPWKKIKEAVSGAVSVAVGVVKQVVHVIVKTVQRIGEGIANVIEKIEDWVIDTAEKAGAFVEGLVQKIGVAAKQFVQYLRSLFDWGDILSTQRYLVDAIDTGLGYASNLAEAAKTPVSGFISELRESVEKNLTATREKMSKGSTEVGKSGPKLPEALEWFLSKLTSGSKTSQAPSASPTGSSNEQLSQLNQFFIDLQTDLATESVILIRELAGLGSVLQTLAQNPYRPQIAFAAFLGVGQKMLTSLLNLLDKFATRFLDVIAQAVEQFRTIIKAEINIPFIKGLFKTIGLGRFSLLDVTALLIAIPATIISKLATGKAPFEGEPKFDLSRNTSIMGWGVTSVVTNGVNGLIAALLDVTPEDLDDPLEVTAGGGLEIISLLLDCIGWLGSFPDSPGLSFPNPPDFEGGRPYAIALERYEVTKTKHEKLYWQRIVWAWRSAILGLDIGVMAWSFLFAGNRLHQRLKRRHEGWIAFSFLLGMVDVGLTAKYHAVSKPGLDDAADVSNEYIAMIPGLLGFLRLPVFTPYAGSFIVAVLDIVCTTVIGTVIGGIGLGENESEGGGQAIAGAT